MSSTKTIVKVIHQGQGRKLRTDNLSTWDDLITKISTKLDNQTILSIKDDDGDILDDLNLLSHGDTLHVETTTATTTTATATTATATTTTATTPSTTQPAPSALGTRIMRALLPNDAQTQQEPLHINISQAREQLMSILANLTHAKGAVLLRTLRFLMVNIQTHPNEDKYKSISHSRLQKTTEIDVPRQVMQVLGFTSNDTTTDGTATQVQQLPSSTKKIKKKYTYSKIVHQPTTLAVVGLLDNLFVETRQLSQRNVTRPLITSTSHGGETKATDSSGGNGGSSGGLLWSQRHQAMAAASSAGMTSPMLSSDRLRIFIDGLKERRNKMFEDGPLTQRNIKLFNADGAEMFVGDEDREKKHSSSNSSSNSSNSSSNNNNNIESTVVASEPQEEEQELTSQQQEELDRKRESLARQRLINLRKASEDQKKQQNQKFRSKATRELDRMHTKDGKYSKATVKITERGTGISIVGQFNVCENGQDVLDFLVEECLSVEAQTLITNGTLELHLECRDPTPRSSGKAENVTMAMTAITTALNSFKKGDEMSMLEWNCVPRGRVWLSLYTVGHGVDGSANKRVKASFQSHLINEFQEVLTLDGN